MFTTLQPRQRITPTPYAINAVTAGSATTAANVTGSISDSQLSGNIARLNTAQTFAGNVTLNNASGSFSGNGASLSNVNAATLSGLAATQLWKVGGNSGTTTGTDFIGTSDNQALELKVNGTRALRLEPRTNTSDYSNVVNVVAGSPVNMAAAGTYGATISGGGAANYFGIAGTNRVQGDFGTVGGGYGNAVLARQSTIGGGTFNVIQASARDGTIAGGNQNTIRGIAYYATIGGGQDNTIHAYGNDSVIGGGSDNQIMRNESTVPHAAAGLRHSRAPMVAVSKCARFQGAHLSFLQGSLL